MEREGPSEREFMDYHDSVADFPGEASSQQYLFYIALFLARIADALDRKEPPS
jgi:hypothetical protein